MKECVITLDKEYASRWFARFANVLSGYLSSFLAWLLLSDFDGVDCSLTRTRETISSRSSGGRFVKPGILMLLCRLKKIPSWLNFFNNLDTRRRRTG